MMILAVILLSPILICVGFILLNRLDAKLCVQQMARNVGVAPTYSSIQEYILESLKPGMVRGDVDEILMKIAPIKTRDSVLDDGDTIHQVVLVPCIFAMNNIVVMTGFDKDGLFRTAWIEEFP